MRKLSKKYRLNRAVNEAEEHGRTYGIKQADDWVFSIAFHWGFEEDIPSQKIIAEALLRGFDNAGKKTEPLRPGGEEMESELEHLSWNVLRKKGEASYPRNSGQYMSGYERKKFLELWKEVRNKIWDGNPPLVGRIGRKQKGKRSNSSGFK